MGRLFRIATDAFRHFNEDDGWAISSHLALSALMALFPFILVLTALAAVFGSKDLADEATRILLETWPEEVSAPLALELHGVLTSARGGALTLGALLALLFASSGVESLRVGLNRAYDCQDMRSWWLLRIESVIYVLVGACGLLALAFLVFLAPLIWQTAVRYLPRLEPLGAAVTFVRLAVAAALLIIALLVAHLWLAAGKRRLRDVIPGIVATLVLWLGAGTLFGLYLAEFAFAYSIYYAGLASPMIALVFLYLAGAIFIYGGELNHVLSEMRREKEQEAPPPVPTPTD